MRVITRGDVSVAVAFDRGAIRAALAMADPAISSYLDLATGTVVTINESDSSAAMEEIRNKVMDGYGDQYRYIPGGNAGADDAAVAQWLETEGL